MKQWCYAVVLLCLLSSAWAEASWAQVIAHDSSYYRQPRYGLFGAADFITHRANFQSLPGVPNCCPMFTSGDGTGYTAGVVYEHPMRGQWLLGGRLAFEHVPALFRSREATTFIIDGKATPGAFEHELKASYNVIWAHHTIGYRALDSLPGLTDLVGYIGVGIGFTTGSSFSQRETIVEPGDVGEFTDTRSAVRNGASGTISDINAIAADVRLGISSHVPLNSNRTLLLAPEIWYSIGLTDVVPSLSWHAHELRLGAALQYIPQENPAGGYSEGGIGR